MWGIIASVAGGLLSSQASSDAADAQSASSAASVAEQRRQFDRTEQLQAPFRAGGEAGLNELLRLYGLTPSRQAAGGFSGVPGSPGFAAGTTPEALRSQLLPQFTTGAQAGGFYPPENLTYGPNGNSEDQVWRNATPGTVNEAGLQAEIQRLSASPGQSAADQAAAQAADPLFGSGLRDFTQDEIQMDPGYQFGLNQGQQAIDRKIAAGGGRVSGAAIKAAGQYGTDYATQGYSTAYNRKNQSRNDRLNRLASLAGVGQTSAQQVGQAGQVMANNVSNTMQSQGDATAANRLNQGNIWSNTGNQLAALYGRKNTPSYINPATGAGYGYASNYDK